MVARACHFATSRDSDLRRISALSRLQHSHQCLKTHPQYQGIPIFLGETNFSGELMREALEAEVRVESDEELLSLNNILALLLKELIVAEPELR